MGRGSGDYLIKVSQNVQCWFCGEIIKKNSRCIRLYGTKQGKIYYHSTACDGIKEALGG